MHIHSERVNLYTYTTQPDLCSLFLSSALTDSNGVFIERKIEKGTVCILEEFGVFPGLLHTTSERYIDWHNTSNKTSESKGDRTKHAGLSNIISYTSLIRGTSLDLHPCKW